MVSKRFNTAQDILHTQAVLRKENDPARIMNALILPVDEFTANTRHAILIALAAEKVFQIAKKAEELAQKHEGCIEYYKSLVTRDRHAARAFIEDAKVSHNDDVFSKVLSDGSMPAALRQAQATWLAAQLYLNNELSSIAEGAAGSQDDFRRTIESLGASYGGGFKRAAGALYLTAAAMLKKDGLPADRFEAVGHGILNYAVDKDVKLPMPSDCVRRLTTLFNNDGLMADWDKVISMLITVLPRHPEQKPGTPAP